MEDTVPLAKRQLAHEAIDSCNDLNLIELVYMLLADAIQKVGS